ncbi:hypothetical protein QF031_001645 [Pseudarthrobacter defluvii]|uniref:hypothetical protein n=1 Tax=Pseudarthrobacter defluvii TaxID=410837 RepID=UPI002782CB13|nr:hypothetical protein [Pseudarthrobacter defluvii]MDQ0768896.1 hypothetical protein [Pseudarthrobacter defluvii]
MTTTQSVALIFVGAFVWIGLTLLVLLTLRRRRKGSSVVASAPPPPGSISYRPHRSWRRPRSVSGQSPAPRRRLRLRSLRH